mgnify:FL=1
MAIIDKPTDYFNTVLWSGDNVDGRAITTGLETNWTWAKRRNATNGFIIADSVRGATYKLDSSTTNAEVNNYDGGHLESFTSTGFTMGVGSGDFGHLNASGGTYVAWNWKAGTSFTNDASATGIGTLDSSGSVNATAGFSIISFTGTETSSQSVAHGLGAVPELIISKSLAVADNWMVHHGSFSAQDYISLNTTAAKASASSVWTSLPTSTVINIGDNAGVNDNGAMIMYAFRSVQGYSKFGSYTGNGSTDGTFVYTGFKPAWFMIKRTDANSYWTIFDNKRSSSGGSNEIDYSLDANVSNAEETGTSVNDVDFLSNGIKIREDNGDLNASGSTIIYMAFAEAPFVTSSGVPATAR